MKQQLSIYDEMQSPAEVLEMLSQNLKQLGVKRMSYHFAPPFTSLSGEDVTVAASGFDPQWVELYKDRAFRASDPVPDHVVAKGEPMTWLRALGEAGHRGGSSDFVLKYFEMGMGDGYAMPLYAGNGYDAYGAVSFDTAASLQDTELLSQIRDHMQFAHMRVVTLVRQERQQRYSLTPRETEVLKFLAHGQSKKHISQAMQLAPASVDTYIRRIYRKLGVTERVSAALKGLTLGLVRL